MNYAEQKKLTAATNKLLREADKKKAKSRKKKSEGSLPYKLFTQTKGHFLPSQQPTCILLKSWDDWVQKNRQNGRFEFLENKTYYTINLKQPGIYFFQNMEIVLKRDFYYKPGSNGFFSLSNDGKICLISETEVQFILDDKE